MKKENSALCNIFLMARKYSGFTLIEVLLAVVILAIVMSIIYSSLFGSIDAMDATRKKMDVYQRAQLVFTLISQDFEGAYHSDVTSWYSFTGENHERNDYPNDSVSFISTTFKRMSKDTPGTDLCEIGYYLVFPDSESETGKLFRRTDSTPDKETDKGGISWEILDEVVGFNVEYFNQTEWVDVWKTTGINMLLPKAVKITLIFRLNDGTDFKISDFVSLPLA